MFARTTSTPDPSSDPKEFSVDVVAGSASFQIDGYLRSSPHLSERA
jgi:hypothetical protein